MSSPNAAPPGFRDPGRVPPNGCSPPGGQRSLPAARRLSIAAQRQVPARLRSGTASLNRTCSETHPAPYPRERLQGNQWFSLMKAHIGTDVASGLVHTVVGTPANTHDLTVAGDLLHGGETDIHADAGYQGAVNRGIAPEATWHIAMRPGKRRLLEAGSAVALAERVKAQVRARVEHPFRVVKRQFGYVKVRYRGLAKNTAQLVTLFALSNLSMVRHTVRVG